MAAAAAAAAMNPVSPEAYWQNNRTSGGVLNTAGVLPMGGRVFGADAPTYMLGGGGKAPAPAAGAAKSAAAGAAGAAGGDGNPKSVIDIWGKLLLRLSMALLRMPLIIFNAVVYLKLFLFSLIGASVVIGIIAVVIYLLVNHHPRLPMLSHSAPFDKFMSMHIETLTHSMRRLLALNGTPGATEVSARGGLGGIIENCSHLMQRPNIADDIVTHYKYYVELRKMPPGYFAARTLQNAEEFSVEGDVDANLVRHFRDSVRTWMSNLKSAVSTASENLHNHAWNPFHSIDAYEIASHVHNLKVHLDYHDDITRLYATRKDGGKVPFAIWTVYYVPYVEDVYKHRIPEKWRMVAKDFVRYFMRGMDFWADAGIWLSLMPCRLAYTDPAERDRKCKAVYEGYEDLVARRNKRWADREKELIDGDGDEIVETISIGKALSTIANLAKSVVDIVKGLIRYLKMLGSDPFAAIVGIVALILGTIIGVVLLYIYILLTISLGFWANWVLICFFLSFGLAFWYTIYQFFMTILVAIPYFVLWLLDLVTNGLICKILRCENLPNSWAEQGGFADENGYTREPWGFGPCFVPCRDSYTTHTFTCTKRPGHLPNYCPQQQIYRLFRGDTSLPQPYVFEKYTANKAFAQKSLPGRQRELINAYRDKILWYQSCYHRLYKRDYINVHVCSNIRAQSLYAAGIRDITADTRKYDDADRMAGQLQTLCREIYCLYKKSNVKTTRYAKMTSSSERASSAACRLTEQFNTKADTDAMGPGTELMKRSILFGIVTITMLVVVYSMLQAAKQMMKDATPGDAPDNLATAGMGLLKDYMDTAGFTPSSFGLDPTAVKSGVSGVAGNLASAAAAKLPGGIVSAASGQLKSTSLAGLGAGLKSTLASGKGSKLVTGMAGKLFGAATAKLSGPAKPA